MISKVTSVLTLSSFITELSLSSLLVLSTSTIDEPVIYLLNRFSRREHRLARIPGPGESYSDVILRLVEIGAKGPLPREDA